MNVPKIDSGAGSLTAAPRTDAPGETSPPASAARPLSAPAGRPAPQSPTSGIDLTRLAWFDANGDGRIDTRAAGSGGDATLLVPAHQVDLPTYGRVAPPASGIRSAGAKHPDDTGETDRNPAQTQRAVAAYQRYGQSPAAPTAIAALPTAVVDATSAASAAPLHAVA